MTQLRTREVTVRYEVLGEEHLLSGYIVGSLEEARELGFVTIESRGDKRAMIPWERIIGVVERG